MSRYSPCTFNDGIPRKTATSARYRYLRKMDLRIARRTEENCPSMNFATRVARYQLGRNYSPVPRARMSYFFSPRRLLQFTTSRHAASASVLRVTKDSHVECRLAMLSPYTGWWKTKRVVRSLCRRFGNEENEIRRIRPLLESRMIENECPFAH